MPWQPRFMLLPTFGTVIPVGKAEAWFVATNCPTFRSPDCPSPPMRICDAISFPSLLPRPAYIVPIIIRP